MTGLGALQGIYLGILGFTKFADNVGVTMKLVFALPLLTWMLALYHCLKVLMTELVFRRTSFDEYSLQKVGIG